MVIIITIARHLRTWHGWGIVVLRVCGYATATPLSAGGDAAYASPTIRGYYNLLVG